MHKMENSTPRTGHGLDHIGHKDYIDHEDYIDQKHYIDHKHYTEYII